MCRKRSEGRWFYTSLDRSSSYKGAKNYYKPQRIVYQYTVMESHYTLVLGDEQ